MKKFTESINENVNRYAGDQKIYNEINNIINETLVAKMNGEVSDKVSLIGQDNLVKELSKIVENKILKTKIDMLEEFKKNPNMIQEKISDNPIKELKTHYKKIANSIASIENKNQVKSVKNMIDNFAERFEIILYKKYGKMNWVKFMRESDIDKRVAELKNELKNKIKSLEEEKTK
jgi:hypothetical protein